MSVDIDNLRTFLKAMISSDPLFQGFTFISWLIFVHSKQTSKQKSAKQNKNTYNEKKSSGTLIISPLSRNFRHRKLAFQEAENMAYARRPVCKQTTKNTAANQYPLILTCLLTTQPCPPDVLSFIFFSFNKHASCATAIYFSFTHPINGKGGIYCHMR